MTSSSSTCGLGIELTFSRNINSMSRKREAVCVGFGEIGAHVTASAMRSASRMRSSPDMSRGRRASRT